MVRGDTNHGINNRLNASKIFIELKCARVIEAEILFCVELVRGKKDCSVQHGRFLASRAQNWNFSLHKKAAQYFYCTACYATPS